MPDSLQVIPTHELRSPPPDRRVQAEEEEKEKQRIVDGLDPAFRLVAYKEKYANFRHFDNLRWQVPGLAFLVGGVLLTFGGRTAGELPMPGLFLLYGIFSLLCARLMYRVGVGLRANNEVLRRYSRSFGDDSIPAAPLWRGASRYIEFFLAAVGLLAVVAGLAESFGIL